MQELERMISIYHTAFVVSLVLAILFFAVSVVLFFRFDIRKIFDMRTGRAEKRTIREMEELNAQTGKLRPDMKPYTSNKLKIEDRITYPITTEIQGTRPERERRPEPEKRIDTGSEETELLSSNVETTVLAGAPPQGEPLVKRELPGQFEIVKEILWIHTKEEL